MGEKEDQELLKRIIPGESPEKIDAAQRLVARSWRCDRCGYVTRSKVRIKVPAPCVQCAGVAFKVCEH
jgi:predicted Zn-ribbon and HTH transcriptional regulator